MCDFFCGLSDIKDNLELAIASASKQKIEINKLKQEVKDTISGKKINCTNSKVKCPSGTVKVNDINKEVYEIVSKELCCVSPARCYSMNESDCNSGKILDPDSKNQKCGGQFCDSSDSSLCCKTGTPSGGGGGGSATANPMCSTIPDSICTDASASPMYKDSTKSGVQCLSSPCAIADKSRCCTSKQSCSALPSAAPSYTPCASGKQLKSNAFCATGACATTDRSTCCEAATTQRFTGHMYIKTMKTPIIRLLVSLFIICLTVILMQKLKNML